MIVYFEKDRWEIKSPSIQNGMLKVFVKENSWYKISDIPKQKGVINMVDNDYPQFTTQLIEGEVMVKDGVINTKDIDDLFPKDWSDYNTHYFFEGIEDDGSIFLGS